MLIPKGITVINNLNFDRHSALLNVADFCKCLVRKVYHSAFYVRASVVNFNFDRLIIGSVSHSHYSAKGLKFYALPYKHSCCMSHHLL